MLDRLKKQLGIKDTPVSLEAQELQTQLASLKTEFENVKQELTSQIASLAAEKDNLEAALATALEAVASLEAAAKESAEKQLNDKLTARKAKLENVIGTAKVDAAFEAVKGLEDAAFDAVVAAMATSLNTEAKSELFQETGVAEEVEPSKVMSTEEKILRDKYNQN